MVYSRPALSVSGKVDEDGVELALVLQRVAARAGSCRRRGWRRDRAGCACRPSASGSGWCSCRRSTSSPDRRGRRDGRRAGRCWRGSGRTRRAGCRRGSAASGSEDGRRRRRRGAGGAVRGVWTRTGEPPGRASVAPSRRRSAAIDSAVAAQNPGRQHAPIVPQLDVRRRRSRRRLGEHRARVLAATLARVKLTVTVITLNEAAHIEAALASVAWADEIIVVDSGSTDGTVENARRLATRVEVRDWPGYGAQKNRAGELASHDWILSLDADERVHAGAGRRDPRHARAAARPRLSDSASDVVSRALDPEHRLVSGSRSCGSTIAARARWNHAAGARAVELDGPPGRLRHELQHFAYRDVSHHLSTIDRYTTLAAEQWLADGRRTTALAAVVHPPLAFLRNYVLRRGFADGAAGLLVSALNSYYVFLKLVKLWERQQIAAVRPAHRAGASDAPAAGPEARRADRDVLPPHRHGAELARRPEPGAGHGHGPARARSSGDAGRASERTAASAREGGARPDSAGAGQRDGPERRLAAVAAASSGSSRTSSTPTIRTAWRWRRWRSR